MMNWLVVVMMSSWSNASEVNAQSDHAATTDSNSSDDSRKDSKTKAQKFENFICNIGTKGVICPLFAASSDCWTVHCANHAFSNIVMFSTPSTARGEKIVGTICAVCVLSTHISCSGFA